MVLRYSALPSPVRLPGCHRLWPAFPEPFDLRLRSSCAALQPPPASRQVWASPLSLATTRRIVSFPPGTEMFQFPGFPSRRYVFTPRRVSIPPRGFPHSDISGWSRVHTPHRSFSQCTTSFLGSWRQGIHRALLVAYPTCATEKLMFSRFAMLLLRCPGVSPGDCAQVPLDPLTAGPPMETRGLEPLTYALQRHRSPS